jgi:hypothetical protein
VSPECGGEYTVVEWEEGREVMCAEHQTLWLKSQNIKVLFRSQAGGTFGRGLRLDAACYAATPPEGLPDTNCSRNNHIPSQSVMAEELSAVEEQLLGSLFSLHFQLHMLREACRRSVQDCGTHYSHHISSSNLAAQLEQAASATTCSPLLHSLQSRTLRLYGH